MTKIATSSGAPLDVDLNQIAYERVRAHLAQPGFKKAVNKGGFCDYITESGSGCANAPLLSLRSRLAFRGSLSSLHPGIGNPVHNAVYKEIDGMDIHMLMEFQRVHDTTSIPFSHATEDNDWQEWQKIVLDGIDAIAEEYGLTLVKAGTDE
jgi:hypothetical protein